jgi:hypothetical protein
VKLKNKEGPIKVEGNLEEVKIKITLKDHKVNAIVEKRHLI